MANIKISELNELLPGQKAYDDYLAIVDSSADETKKISVETLTSTGVKLIAVSSTAPTEFSNGDKYYNSTTNRIYEARTDVWYNPQEPVEGIFYIIFDSQNIYTYDKENETLVSVGGGAGGGRETLPVGSEINFDGQASDIPTGWEQVESYSTSEVKTGDTWIDGKPIYRKVVNFGTLPNATSKNVAHNISNLSNIVNIKGWTKRADGTTFPLPYESGSQINESIALFTNNTNISIYCGVNRTEFTTTYITLEYTKTTD